MHVAAADMPRAAVADMPAAADMPVVVAAVTQVAAADMVAAADTAVIANPRRTEIRSGGAHQLRRFCFDQPVLQKQAQSLHRT
jgi:hypothetical protein